MFAVKLSLIFLQFFQNFVALLLNVTVNKLKNSNSPKTSAVADPKSYFCERNAKIEPLRRV